MSDKKKTGRKNGNGKKKDKEEKVEIPEPPIKRVKYDSRVDTYKHIQDVQKCVFTIIGKLSKRAMLHDASKLEDPEKEFWDKYTPLLENMEYNSPEYKASLEALKPCLAHHYAKNSHHPEHYPEGVNDMTLLDIIEMFCDWKAATARMNDGNIRQSLETNKTRFRMSPQLYKIFENTIKELSW